MSRRFKFFQAVAILGVAFLALNGLITPRAVAQGEPDDQDQVESYLRSLQLDQLVIEHVEMSTAGETDEKARGELARRLVMLYSQQLMTGQPTKTGYHQKAAWLLRAYPQLSTPAIRMAMLQAKYTDVEQGYLDWWYDGASANNKTTLVDDLRELNSELSTLGRKLEEEYQDRITVMQTSPENRAAESRMILQTENLVLHGHYLSGWTNYFRGVLSTDQRIEHFRTANQHFRKFLQIEPQKILNEVSPKWFDFTSDWSTRALVGLSMCEKGLNHDEQAKYCLDLIEENSTNQRTRDMRYVWELNSQLYIGQLSEFDSLIQAGRSKAMSVPGSIRFWNELLKASIAIRTQSLTKSESLMANGLSGLARNFQANLINDFLESNRLSLEANESWELWVAGYLDFAEAESARNHAQFEVARKKLTQAIELAGPEANPDDIHCCRYLLARIDLVNKRYEPAAKAFQEVSDAMLSSNQNLASEAQWLAIVALSKLGEKEPRNAFKAIRLIDQATIRFPGSTVAKRAKFERLRLGNLRLPADKAIENLERIESSDPNFPLALNEIVKSRYQRLIETLDSRHTDNAVRIQRFDELVASEAKYRELSGVSVASKLKASLLIVDALFRINQNAGDELDSQRILEHLNIAKELANRITNSPEHIEYRFYELQFAIRTGDMKRAESEATWQVENAQGSKFEKSALIQLAQMADKAVKSQTDPTSESILKAVSAFERLLEVVGTTDEALLTFANARVGYSRLAELYLMAGQHQKAVQMSQNLVQLFPKHVTFMRQLAKARIELKEYEKAIPIWRQLAKGVDPGTETWFESKYYLAQCHFHNGDSIRANELIQQTIRLGGVIPETWKIKFDDFEKQLAGALDQQAPDQDQK